MTRIPPPLSITAMTCMVALSTSCSMRQMMMQQAEHQAETAIDNISEKIDEIFLYPHGLKNSDHLLFYAITPRNLDSPNRTANMCRIDLVPAARQEFITKINTLGEVANKQGKSNSKASLVLYCKRNGIPFLLGFNIRGMTLEAGGTSLDAAPYFTPESWDRLRRLEQ